MINQHPITPPPELVQQWNDEGTEMLRPECQLHLATRAAQWGADQELEACKQWLSLRGHAELAIKLGYCMRNKPKPPSLKEQALEQLGCIQADLNKFGMGISTDTIRRALEALPDD